MKNYLVLPALAMALSASSAQAREMVFGNNAGKDVPNVEMENNVALKDQVQALQALLAEAKTTNKLLTDQNALLQQQLDNQQKQTLALLKGFEAIMEKKSGTGLR